MNEEPQIIKKMRTFEETLPHQQELSSDDYTSDSSVHTQFCQIETSEQQKGEDNNKTIQPDLELYQKLVENLLEGIIILDFRGKVLYANHAVIQLFGFETKDEVIGKNALDFIDPKFHGRVIRDQLLVRLGKGGFLDTYQAITRDGRTVWIEGLGCKIKYKGHTSNVVFIRDISDRRKTWDKLIKLERKYRAIAEMSADGIITLDPLGKLTYVNPSFLKMIDRKQDETLDTLFREYIHVASIYDFQQILMDSRKKNKDIHHIQLELQNTTGAAVPVEISITPIKDEKDFTGYLCTIHDITERRNMEREMQKSERLKTEFMNIAAHELKSPVTPIKGYLDLIISDEESNEKIKKWAQVSLRNADRLLLLVNDILDVSRLDNDTMKFEMRKIESSELLMEMAEDMRAAIESKHLEFNVQIPSNLPPILGDYHRLHQVFKNLFVNALKFTDQGSITFKAENKQTQIVISVEDSGIGIRQEDLQKIFEKFYQAETADNRKHEGTGLGLFICRQIIQKHKGDIAAKSTPRKGTTFYVTLPALEKRNPPENRSHEEEMSQM